MSPGIEALVIYCVYINNKLHINVKSYFEMLTN